MDIKPLDCGLDGLTFTEPTLCKFEFAADCDLKNIIERFLQTGQLPEARDATSGDVINSPRDFQELQDKVAACRQQFDRLPPDEREKYGNDVEAWLVDQLNPPADDKPQPEPEPDKGGDLNESDKVE